MTDIDPRLEAAKDALRRVQECGQSIADWEIERVIIIHDALRAFDQAQPTADRERIIRDIQREAVRQELNAQPQPESEVMPPEPERRSSLDNATAPV